MVKKSFHGWILVYELLGFAGESSGERKSDGGEARDELPVEVAGSKELLELLDCLRLWEILDRANLLKKRGAARLGDHMT